MDLHRLFTTFASSVSRAAGKPLTFVLCCVALVAWAVSGPVFGFSDTWQLVINTGTTIVTFLMVFLIQNTQNRDNAALHAKLDELIRTQRGAENTLVGIEKLTDRELEAILAKEEADAAPERQRAAAVAQAEIREEEMKKRRQAPRTSGVRRKPPAAKARARSKS